MLDSLERLCATYAMLRWILRLLLVHCWWHLRIVPIAPMSICAEFGCGHQNGRGRSGRGHIVGVVKVCWLL